MSEQTEKQQGAEELKAEAVNEEPAAVPEEAPAESAEEACRRELEQAQAAAADYKDKWMRSVAEFDNFRKRNEQTRRNAYLDGKAEIVVKVLPVGDNLELALRSCADEQTKKGIEMVLRAFNKLLEEEGITAIDPKDEEFDPAFCEVSLVEDVPNLYIKVSGRPSPESKYLVIGWGSVCPPLTSGTDSISEL